MRSMRAIAYFCSRRIFSVDLKQCGSNRGNDANYTVRWMSRKTPCLKNILPQTTEGPRLPVELDQVPSKEKPVLPSRLADFADRSSTLQKLIDLGVEIHRFDRDWHLCKFVLSLDFERNIKPYLEFLLNQGLENEDLGPYLTNNPHILKCSLEDLQVRINYLQSKSFTKSMIKQLITGNPKWLSYEVKTVDSMLGDLQKMFKLTGNDVRTLALNFPRILNMKKDKLQLSLVMFKEQLQLTSSDLKKMVVKEPILLVRDPNEIMRSFYYTQDHMALPVHLVVEQPNILLCKVHVLTIRHKFLVKLGRAQYDPKQPGYVSIQSFCTKDDKDFCRTVAMTTVDVFYNFQKTL